MGVNQPLPDNSELISNETPLPQGDVLPDGHFQGN